MENANASTQLAPAADTLQERIKKLLGNGLPGTIVASTVGCDPSYVSQLMEDEGFKNDVLVLRAGKAQGAVARDTSWDTVEQMALDKAIQMLPLVSRPNDLIRLAAFANSAKRRATEYAGAQETGASVVNIILPQAAAVHFQMNNNSQVVEIDGRSTAALPTKHLQEMMKERKLARDAAGVTTVQLPALTAPVPATVVTERKKVESILERIGFADEAVPVPKIL